jgi:uncharacterized membrane protein
MSKLWETVLNAFNYIGDNSGCHQIEERCFTIKGYTFPICARCTGVTIGQIAAIILFCFKYRMGLIISLVLLAIMGFDWLIQYLKIYMSNNTRRFITGILGGFGLFNIYMYIIITILSYFNINLTINCII